MHWTLSSPVSDAWTLRMWQACRAQLSWSAECRQSSTNPPFVVGQAPIVPSLQGFEGLNYKYSCREEGVHQTYMVVQPFLGSFRPDQNGALPTNLSLNVVYGEKGYSWLQMKTAQGHAAQQWLKSFWIFFVFKGLRWNLNLNYCWRCYMAVLNYSPSHPVCSSLCRFSRVVKVSRHLRMFSSFSMPMIR